MPPLPIRTQIINVGLDRQVGIKSMDVEQKFIQLVPGLERASGGPVHLIRIIGSRWAFISGASLEGLPFILPQKVQINDEWALMFYPKEGVKIDAQQIKALFL